MQKSEEIRRRHMATGLAVGIALGTGLGVAFGNVALGIGPGIALGLAIGALRAKRAQTDSDTSEQSSADDT